MRPTANNYACAIRPALVTGLCIGLGAFSESILAFFLCSVCSVFAKKETLWSVQKFLG